MTLVTLHVGIAGFPKNPGFHGVQYTLIIINYYSLIETHLEYVLESHHWIQFWHVFSCLFHLPAPIRTGKGKYLWNNGHYYEGTARHGTARHGGLESQLDPWDLVTGDWEADQMHGEGVWGQGRSFHQTRFRLQSFHVISCHFHRCD